MAPHIHPEKRPFRANITTRTPNLSLEVLWPAHWGKYIFGKRTPKTKPVSYTNPTLRTNTAGQNYECAGRRRKIYSYTHRKQRRSQDHRNHCHPVHNQCYICVKMDCMHWQRHCHQLGSVDKSVIVDQDVCSDVALSQKLLPILPRYPENLSRDRYR